MLLASYYGLHEVVHCEWEWQRRSVTILSRLMSRKREAELGVLRCSCSAMESC